MSKAMTPEQVNEAFLAAPPLMSESILDLTVTHPSWLSALYEVTDWPQGSGTVMQQLIFRGAMPQIERGTEQWKKLGNLSGCDPCEGPDCTYNWSTFGGYGFDRKLTELMSREFRSDEYCVHEIQTTYEFDEVFSKLVENLYRQTAFFKEINIGQNFLTMLAKKYVVDAQGAKPNTNNPYVYRNTGGVKLSALNIEMLEFFYESMRRIPDVVPYDVIDGAPLYSLIASPQLLSRLYRDDATLRQDVRFSGMANDLLTKYNFMSTIRGMFIAAPFLYPRRFNIVAGEPVEVLPYVNDVPAEVGSYTYLNPAYEAATHEEVLLHGRHPFSIFQQPTVSTLGGNSSFGPEASFMNNWMWINPLTREDPMRRTGYFATSARIGLNQQFSQGIFGILVERPSVSLMAMYTPNPVCPEDPPVCENVVPDVTCPCPVVSDIQANPFTPGNYTVTFVTPVEAEVAGDLDLEFDNGLTITTTVVALTSDNLTAELTIPGGLQGCEANQIIGVSCGSDLACSSTVTFVSDCRSGVTNQVEAVLEQPIKAVTAGDEVIAYFGDCTSATMVIVSVDPATATWTLQYAPYYGPTDDPDGAGYGDPLNADLVCDRGGISKLCVPPSTDATCPACDTVLEPCVNPAS